jgi:hypothetical protein
LNCAGLVPSAGSAMTEIQVGEGATPTWETTSNYLIGYTGSGGTNAGTVPNLVATVGSTSNPVSIKLYIDYVSSSSIYKLATWQYGQIESANGQAYVANGTSFWENDTNPITGLRIDESTGNITSGTCSLYGMN